MAARELGAVELGVDSNGNRVEAGSFAAEQATLANAGEAPLLAKPADYTAQDYLRLAGASVAWLALPFGLAAGGVAAAGAVVAGARQIVNMTGPGGAPGPTPTGAAPGLGEGTVVTPTAPPGPLARLLAFAFPRRRTP